MPSIIGDSPAQAGQAISGANLVYRQAAAVAPNARVSRQYPAAGEQVQARTTVEAWFEVTTPAPVTVPSIIGDSPAQAGQAIAGAHLALSQARQVSSPNARVSRQNPPAGTRVQPGTAVEAWFEVTVPSLVGDSPAMAEQATRSANLNLSQNGDSRAGAQVVRQSPAAGERVAVGASVTAWFALPLVTVPSIIGGSPGQAGEIIAGVHLALKQATPVSSPNARVSRQNPSAGARVQQETTVEAWFEVPAPPTIPNAPLVGQTTPPANRSPTANGGTNGSAGQPSISSPPPVDEHTPTAPPEGPANRPADQPSANTPREVTQSPPLPEGPPSLTQAPPLPEGPPSLTQSPPLPEGPPSLTQAPSESPHETEPSEHEPERPGQPLETGTPGPSDTVTPPVIEALPASAQPVSVNVVKFASVAALFGFAAFGLTVHQRRLRRRPRHLTKWKVVPRADPGRQSIAFLADPAGPVLGWRIVQAKPAVELSWAKEETLDA